ncbi:MAG: hypothetical protein WA952_03275, partial [Lewinella sp.]
RSDPELAAAAARYEVMHRSGLRSTPEEMDMRKDLRTQLRELEASIPPVTIARERRLWPTALGAAAAVLLLLVAGWWLLAAPDPDRRLAEENFRWLGREELLLGPGEDALDGLSAYDQQDYERAFPLLRDGVATGNLDSVNLLYAGVSALAIGQPEEAKDLLTAMLNTGEYPFDEPNIHYYLALAELQLKNRAAARRQLELVISQDGEKSDDAGVMLRQLDELDAAD